MGQSAMGRRGELPARMPRHAPEMALGRELAMCGPLIAATIIPVTCNRVIGINQDVADLGSSVVWKKRCAISLVRERFGESG